MVVSDGVSVKTAPAAPHSFSRSAETWRIRSLSAWNYMPTNTQGTEKKKIMSSFRDSVLSFLLSPGHQCKGIHVSIPGSSTGQLLHRPSSLLCRHLRGRRTALSPEKINFKLWSNIQSTIRMNVTNLRFMTCIFFYVEQIDKKITYAFVFLFKHLVVSEFKPLIC